MVALRHHPPPVRYVSAAEIAGVRRPAPDEDDEPPETRDPLVAVRDIDPCDWIEENFWIPSQDKPPAELIRLRLYQKAITRFIFKRRADGRFPFQTIVISQPKKGGKTTWTACLMRWLSETQVRYGDIYAIGNDLDQAKDRSFRFVTESIELTPGYDGGRGRLTGRWALLKKSMRCLTSRSRIVAIAVDAAGEAGGRPYASVWTELWAFEHDAARKLWTEMTPVPTVPDSMRIVDSYAGFEGESELLKGLYDRGKLEGRQLTNRELAEAAARDKDGERYEDFLQAFAETGGNPDAPVPCWVEGRMFMYWDEGIEARRVPEQQTEEYYAEEERTLPPQEFARIHLNVWGTSVTAAIPAHSWEACYDPDLPPIVVTSGDSIVYSKQPMVLSCDAGISGDCFAIMAVTRHPMDNARPALRAARLWTPKDFPDGRIIFDDDSQPGYPYQFLKWCVQSFNVVQICYDPYQLEDMMQRARRDLGVWCEPFIQGKDREIADKRFYDQVIQRNLAWNFHDENRAKDMRQHVSNANKKVQKDQESKMRFIKKGEARKIDLLIAGSMGVDRCLFLVM